MSSDIKIAVTGHRPDTRYLGGYDLNSEINLKIRKLIFQFLYRFTSSNNFDEVITISGGALGVDQMFAYEALRLREIYKQNIKVEIAVPFKNQTTNWKPESIIFYNNILERADKITYVDSIKKYNKNNICIGEYRTWKMQKRNEYMVDECDLLLAVYDGSPTGGTHNCVEYARKKKKMIYYINPKDVWDM